MLMRCLTCSMCLLVATGLACSHATIPAPAHSASSPPPNPPAPPATQPEVQVEKITIGEETFKLEVAADVESRARGLSNRTEIAPDGGMIFIYPNVLHRSFWMRECLVDIDLMFLNGKGVITAMYEMKPDPPRGENEPEVVYESRLRRYPSRRPAQFALEFKAGTLRRLDLKIGDRLDKLDLKHLKSLARKKPGAEDNDDDGGEADKEMRP